MGARGLKTVHQKKRTDTGLPRALVPSHLFGLVFSVGCSLEMDGHKMAASDKWSRASDF